MEAADRPGGALTHSPSRRVAERWDCYRNGPDPHRRSPPLIAGRHAMPDKPKRIPIRLTPEEVRRDGERTRAARLALFNTWIDQAKDG
jgi:hypothetical protein